MARKKKVKEDIKIHGIADKGLAVGRDDEGMVYFVEGAVPGDVVDVLVLRKNKSFQKGIVNQYKSYSSERVEAFCEHFNECGGCKWQHLDYTSQIKYKQKSVEDAFKRIGAVQANTIYPIIGCSLITNYRNKMEYSFSSRRWVPKEELDSIEEISFGPAAGFHKAGAFDKIVQIRKCHLQDNISNKIRNKVDQIGREKEWTYYNSREHHGFFRNLVVRNTTKGDWMIIMVFGENRKEDIELVLDSLLIEITELTSVYYAINEKVNDVIYDLPLHLYHGQPYITESLGHINYKIGPKSFFQTNTFQARVLYDKIVELADLKGHEVVYDLYTGLGSIALYIADKCKHVIGVEEIPEAIQDANENKDFNNIDNVSFEVGDVKTIFNTKFITEHGKPHLVIVDPPRAGLHKDVVLLLDQTGVQRIIYVSCNPSTQARDIALLENNYIVDKLQAVDMFPHTHHIENIALLRKKEEHERS